MKAAGKKARTTFFAPPARCPWSFSRVNSTVTWWKVAIPVLIDDLQKDYIDDARYRAAEALGEIGPPAREAVSALQEAVKAGSPEVSKAAAAALKKIGSKTASQEGTP